MESRAHTAEHTARIFTSTIHTHLPSTVVGFYAHHLHHHTRQHSTAIKIPGLGPVLRLGLVDACIIDGAESCFTGIDVLRLTLGDACATDEIERSFRIDVRFCSDSCCTTGRDASADSSADGADKLEMISAICNPVGASFFFTIVASTRAVCWVGNREVRYLVEFGEDRRQEKMSSSSFSRCEGRKRGLES